MAKTKVLICPYCGDTQPAGERCRACGGLFEPLSRQATHNEMGPWFIRNLNRPFQPGCSYETVIKLIERGQITKLSILRGPTTKQFWTIARRVPGVAHLLGYCHNCDAPVDVEDHGCHACGVPFGAYLDRNYLGLPEVRPLPWEAPADEVARKETFVASRPRDFRGAAEPLGISSFASDAELRGEIGAAGSETQGLHASNLHMLSSAGGVGGFSVNPDVTAVAPPPDDRPVSAGATLNAAASAQRTLDHQRQTIRWLTFGLIAVVLVAAIAIIALFVTSQAPPDEFTGATPPVMSELPGEPIPAKQVTPPAPPSVDRTATPERLDALMEIVRNDKLSLNERIEAGDEALRLLKDVASSTEPDDQRADLADQIAALEKELDDLRLKAFFP